MKTKQLNFKSFEPIAEYDSLFFFKPIGSKLTRVCRIPDALADRVEEVRQILDATCMLRRNNVWYYKEADAWQWAMSKLIDIEIACFHMEPEAFGLDDMGWPIPQFLN